MIGMKVVLSFATSRQIDVDDLRAKIEQHRGQVAALMLLIHHPWRLRTGR